MKKIFSAILAVVMCLFSGCSLLTGDTSNISSNKIETNESVPEYIADFYNSYEKLSNEYDFSFELLSGGPITDENNSFNIYFNKKGELKTNPKKLLKNLCAGFFNVNEKYKNTFTVEFSLKKDIEVIKDFITATFMTLDSKLNRTDAEIKSNHLISTYEYGSFSDVEKVGEYYLYITEAVKTRFVCTNIPENDDTVWKDVDITQYIPLTNQLLSDFDKFNEKTYISGTITNIKSDFSRIDAVITLDTDIGECYIVYDLMEHPVKYALGDSITVYGTLENYNVKTIYDEEMVLRSNLII